MNLKDKVIDPHTEDEQKPTVSLEVLHTLNERIIKLKELHSLFTPHKKQEEVVKAIFQDGVKYVFIRAGRRSGKTAPSIYVAVRQAISYPNQKILIVLPTLKQAKKIYWKSRKIHKFIHPNWNVKFSNDDLTIHFPNGSYIEIDGSDNTESHRGTEYEMVLLDEYKDMSETIYSEVIEPMLATTDGIIIIIGTPPKSIDNHFYKQELIIRQSPNWRFFHWTSLDSPYTNKEWLKNKELELVKRGEMDVYKREYLAEYCFGGKDQVFPMFNKRKHVKPRDTILAIMKQDWSRFDWFSLFDPATSSTFAVLFFAYDRSSNRIFILDEIYAQDKAKTTSSAIWEEVQIKQRLLNPKANWQYVYDEAGVWFSNEIMNRYGIYLTPSKKAKNEKEDGISLIKDLLLIDGCVRISDECTNFIYEMEIYIMENGKYPKKNDHLLDCFRYGLGELNIDFTLSTNGVNYRDILDVEYEMLEQDNILALEQNNTLLELKQWT